MANHATNIPSDTLIGRDTAGVIMPGNKLARGNQTGRGQNKQVYLSIIEKKELIQNAISPEQVLNAVREMYEITMDKTIDPDVRVRAFREFSQTVLGKPQRESNIHITKTDVKLSAQLPDMTLEQIEYMRALMEGKAKVPENFITANFEAVKEKVE